MSILFGETPITHYLFNNSSNSYTPQKPMRYKIRKAISLVEGKVIKNTSAIGCRPQREDVRAFPYLFIYHLIS